MSDLTAAELAKLVAKNNIEVVRDRARRAEAEVDRLRAELARVRSERDRLFANEIEFRSQSNGRPPIRECLVALSLMRIGPLPADDLAALLAVHDRRSSAAEGER